MGLEQEWESATPVAPATPVSPGQSSIEQQFEQSGPPPSMGQVALNAVPKGIANLLNTPMTLASLIMHGLANLPGAGHLQGLQEAAKSPILQSNEPMDIAVETGLVNPAMNPQTGPQRIVDTAIQAAIGAAAIPAGGVAGAVRGAVLGATSGAAAQTTKELTGSDLLAVAVGMGTPFAVRSLAESGKKIIITEMQKATLKEAQQAGFKVEPSKVREPSSKLESIAGKPAIAQQANMENQALANQQAAKSLGLPENTQFSPGLLDELKKRVAKPYEEVEQLRASTTNLPWFSRYHSTSLIDELKEARHDATTLYKAYYRSDTPDAGVLKAAKAASANAKSIESDIDMVAKAAGKPELLDQLKASRMLYARINDVEKAMNVGSGNISMPVLGRMLDRGAPLSGELAMVARFANAFPRVAREVEYVPPSGVSGTDAAMASALAMGGAAATGSPLGVIAGGLPLARGPARSRVLSEAYQSGLLKEPTPPTPLSTTALRAGMVGKGQAQEGMEEAPAP